MDDARVLPEMVPAARTRVGVVAAAFLACCASLASLRSSRGVEHAEVHVSGGDAFADRGRALEEEYFRKREQELIEKLRRRAAAEATRQQLSEQAGVADEEIL